MLKFAHKGRTLNLPLNKSGFVGDADVDAKSAYVQGLLAGRVVSVGANGVALADGAVLTTRPIGFLVNDAAGLDWENKPALGSGYVAVTRGTENVVTTDQIKTSENFAIGDLLYAGTGADAGLVTKTAPAAGATVIGIALSTASNTQRNLVVAQS